MLCREAVNTQPMVRVSEKWRRVKMSDYDLTILRNLKK